MVNSVVTFNLKTFEHKTTEAILIMKRQSSKVKY